MAGTSSDKLLVARMGVEGGGSCIYGREVGGIWSFWEEGTSMDMDENDDEVWRSWSKDPVSDLDLVLPREWPLFYPLTIHPAFLGWFRQAYEKARSSLSPDLKRQNEEHRHSHWLRILGEGTQPSDGEVPGEGASCSGNSA